MIWEPFFKTQDKNHIGFITQYNTTKVLSLPRQNLFFPCNFAREVWVLLCFVQKYLIFLIIISFRVRNIFYRILKCRINCGLFIFCKKTTSLVYKPLFWLKMFWKRLFRYLMCRKIDLENIEKSLNFVLKNRWTLWIQKIYFIL